MTSSIDHLGTGFFDAHQRRTVAAAMARMIPTDDTPGAREAGTVDFVDRYLAGLGAIYAKPDGSGFETLEGRQAWAWQQRIDSLRGTYAAGIAALDRYSRDMYGADFADLPDSDQDAALRALESGAGPGAAGIAQEQVIRHGGPIEPALQQTSTETKLDFVPLLAMHTRQGFYADPIYGGNRGRVGWDVIGFPGPASLADVHTGRYSVLDYFADDRRHPGQQDHPDG